MSNYHVKSISPNGRNADVIFHIPIPVESNSAGVALRTAVLQYIDSANFISKIPWIDPSETTQLTNGEIYEHSETVKFLAADSNAQKQTKIDSRYTALSTNILNQVREILKFWGLDRNVP